MNECAEEFVCKVWRKRGGVEEEELGVSGLECFEDCTFERGEQGVKLGMQLVLGGY